MKHKVPFIVLFFITLANLLAIVALVLSIARLDVPLSELVVSWDNAESIIEMIIGVAGISITVYFITMGITLRQYKDSLDENLNRLESVNDDMRFQFHEIINVFETIESVAGDKIVYIRLSEGRMLCKSKYSDDNDKMKGIALIQAFYDSKDGINEDNEDVKLLKHLSVDYEVKEFVRTAAQNAVDKILKKEDPPKTAPKQDIVSEMERIARNAVERLKRFLNKKCDKPKNPEKDGRGN